MSESAKPIKSNSGNNINSIDLWIPASVAISGIGTIGLLYFERSSSNQYFLLGLVFIGWTAILKKARNLSREVPPSPVNDAAQPARDNELMKALINSVPGYMTLLDDELRYVMVNEAFAKRMDHNMVGLKLGHTGDEHDFQKYVEDFHHSNKEKSLTQVRFGKRFQKEHYLVSLAKINGPKPLLAVLSMNIEDQKRLEQDLNHAREESAHSERLAILGEMVSSIAHEIRTPLAIISGKAAKIVRKAENRELNAETLLLDAHKVEEMVHRANQIIQTVLKFSRSESDGPMTNLVVTDLLEDVFFLTGPKLRLNGVENRNVGPYPLVKLECYPLQISQVLINLINNAVDALEGKDERWIQIQVRDLDKRIEIRVVDSGSGIPPEIRQKLLEPFFTTKAPGKGTGLGLRISRGIVSRHGGTLEIDGYAANTTFVIDLPKSRAIEAHKQ